MSVTIRGEGGFCPQWNNLPGDDRNPYVPLHRLGSSRFYLQARHWRDKWGNNRGDPLSRIFSLCFIPYRLGENVLGIWWSATLKPYPSFWANSDASAKPTSSDSRGHITQSLPLANQKFSIVLSNNTWKKKAHAFVCKIGACNQKGIKWRATALFCFLAFDSRATSSRLFVHFGESRRNYTWIGTSYTCHRHNHFVLCFSRVSGLLACAVYWVTCMGLLYKALRVENDGPCLYPSYHHDRRRRIVRWVVMLQQNFISARLGG